MKFKEGYLRHPLTILSLIVLLLLTCITISIADDDDVKKLSETQELILTPGKWKHIKSEKKNDDFAISYCGCDNDAFYICYFWEKVGFFPKIVYPLHSQYIGIDQLVFEVKEVNAQRIHLINTNKNVKGSGKL